MRSHFKRQVTSLRLTKRDLILLHYVAKYRYLRSSQLLRLVNALFPGGIAENNGRKRLAKLYDAKLLERIREPDDVKRLVGRGSQPLIYRVTERGHRTLHEARYEGAKTYRLKRHGGNYVRHTLHVAEVMSAVEASAAQASGMRFIDQAQLLKAFPAASLRLETGLFYQNTLQTFGKVPDYIFGLEVVSRPKGRKRLYFYLEADQGTEPIRSSNYARSSLQKTLDLYATIQKQERGLGTYQPLGLPNFRVLITTPKPGRMENLLRFIREEFPKGQSNLFLLADLQTLGSRKVLEHEWLTGAGERVTLLG
jgi:hypothetical protein